MRLGESGPAATGRHGGPGRAGLAVVAGQRGEPLERQLVEQFRRDQVELEDRLPQVAVVFLAVDLGGPHLLGGEQAFLEQDGDQGLLGRREAGSRARRRWRLGGGGAGLPCGGWDWGGRGSTVQISSGCDSGRGSPSGSDRQSDTAVRCVNYPIARTRSVDADEGLVRRATRVVSRIYHTIARSFSPAEPVFPRIHESERPAPVGPRRDPVAGHRISREPAVPGSRRAGSHQPRNSSSRRSRASSSFSGVS